MSKKLKFKKNKASKKDKKVKNKNKKSFTFKNLNIGWKYGISLMIVFLLFGLSTAIVGKLVVDMGENVESLANKGNRAIQLTELESLTRSKSIRMYSYVSDPTDATVQQFTNRKETFDLLGNQIRDSLDTEEQLALFDEIIAVDTKVNELFEKSIVQLISNGHTSNIDRYFNQVESYRAETISLIDQLRTIINSERNKAVDITKDSQYLTFIVLITSVILSIVIGGLLVYLISRSVSRNLKQVVHVSDLVANGDLAVEAIQYDGKDEIGKLASSINTMSTRLRGIIQEISSVSETVSSQSEELTQSANEVKIGSEQIATTMQEIASGSESQANNASDLSSTMGAFTEKMQEANVNGEHIYKSSHEVLSMTSEGTDLMEKSVSQMTVIDKIVKDSVDKVQQLANQSNEISKLVTVIRDVADQTNLLALNAAIEAARAGEQGRGFAVVADEVRKLAEQVALSVKDITAIVQSIQSETVNVVESLQNGYGEVEQGTSQIKTTGETFNKINRSMQEMANNIQSVTESLSIMAASSQEMNASIEEIASISEESAAGVEEASASAEQTSSSMEEVTANSEVLAKLAEKLNVLIKQFKL